MVSSSYRMKGFCLKIWLSVQTKGFYLELLSESSHPATYVPICPPPRPRTHPLICLLIHLVLNSALGRKFNDRRCGLRSQPSVDPNLRGGNRNHPSLLSPRSLPDIRLSGIQIDTRLSCRPHVRKVKDRQKLCDEQGFLSSSRISLIGQSTGNSYHTGPVAQKSKCSPWDGAGHILLGMKPMFK